MSYLTIGEASFDNFGREAPHHEAMSTLGHFRRIQHGLSAGLPGKVFGLLQKTNHQKRMRAFENDGKCALEEAQKQMKALHRRRVKDRQQSTTASARSKGISGPVIG